MVDKDYLFWNDNETVGYFMNKPADPLIENYLKTMSFNDIKMMNALDLGCGCGRHTELLVNNGFATYAIDVNPSMLNATKDRIGKSCNNPAAGLIKGSILSIPFENNFFDIIITTGVLHQARSLDEYKKAILEMARVCKKDAIVLLNIFTNKKMDPTYEIINNFTVRTNEGLLMTLLPKELFYEIMAENGFSIEEEYCEKTKLENTGPRTVLRARFSMEEKR